MICIPITPNYRLSNLEAAYEYPKGRNIPFEKITLVTTVTANKRAKITNSHVPLAKKDYPIVLLNYPGESVILQTGQDVTKHNVISLYQFYVQSEL